MSFSSGWGPLLLSELDDTGVDVLEEDSDELGLEYRQCISTICTNCLFPSCLQRLRVYGSISLQSEIKVADTVNRQHRCTIIAG